MHITRTAAVRAGSIAAFLCVPALLPAYLTGPDPRHTGAPGDQTCAVAGCHTGTDVNSPNGRVEITFPGALNYVPGQRIRLTVTVTDAGMRVFGFQATARLASNLSGGQAGTFTAADTRTQILCEDGRIRPAAGCGAQFALEFITHRSANATNTFTFEWTPPATNVGNVRIYVAGNAGNGNGQNTGDRIYTANYTLTPAADPGVPRPTISQGGVADAFNYSAGLASNGWTAIVGTNLSTVTKTWDDAIRGNQLPTSLEGVSVSINNQPATIFYVSPIQINVLAPNDNATGDVNVVVTSGGTASAPLVVRKAAVKPAFYTPFAQDGRFFVTAVALDGSIVGKPGVDSRVSRGVRPGEVILLFGSGFGPTDPVAPTNQIVSGAPAVTSQVRIRFGETVASFAGTGNLVAAGLYQFNVTIPATLANGDVNLVAEIGGVASSNNVFITVQR